MSADELENLTATFRRGTSRAALPAPGPGALGQAMAHIERATPEETVLARAALAGLYLQAGQAPAQAASPAPLYAEPPEPGERPQVPPELLRLLPLVQPHPDLLHGWLALTSAAGFSLSAPQALPLLPLDDGGSDRLSAPLWALLDDHARWLARLNPAWKKHDPATPPEALHLTRLRRELVEARAADPQASASDLLARWPELKADERRTAMNAVAASIHPADRPLLELATGDRLEDLRRQSRLLLAHLPGELADQTRAALKAQLQVDKEGKLKYVPGDVPAALRDPKPAKGSRPEPDLALLVGATPFPDLRALLGLSGPDALVRLMGLRIGGSLSLYGVLGHSAAAGVTLDELQVLDGHSIVLLPFWPQARIRERLAEALDRLLVQPLDIGLMNIFIQLLTQLDGPLDQSVPPTAPARPGLLGRLKGLLAPPPVAASDRLPTLFARVLQDAAASEVGRYSTQMNLLGALLPHLDPQAHLPPLPPAPPAPKSKAKTPEEAQRETYRRETNRQDLEAGHADLAAQLDLRRQLHALIQHPQGDQP